MVAQARHAATCARASMAFLTALSTSGPGGEWRPHAARKRTSDGYWLQPLRWVKQASERRPRGRARLAPGHQAHREFRSARTVAAASGPRERLDRHDVRGPGTL